MNHYTQRHDSNQSVIKPYFNVLKSNYLILQFDDYIYKYVYIVS